MKYDKKIKKAFLEKYGNAGLIGNCHTCELAGKITQGFRRFPRLEDKEEALKLSYISCDSCFDSVWAGSE
jgi:hypothetical protein